MLHAILNVTRIPELRNKILFTLGMIAVYRIGFWIPLPGVDQDAMVRQAQQAGETGSALGRIADYMAVFSGGSFSQSTIFGLGIMPYISAAIIFQLLGGVVPALKALREEGPTGQQKIQEWTRLTTIGLCIIQGFAWLKFITAQGLVYDGMAGSPVWWIMAVAALTAGTTFLMWLGEQIDKYGIGNGVSIIIMAGILAALPGAINWLIDNFDPAEPGKLGFPGLGLIIGCFILVVAGSVIMTVAQRRIPIQQAKHTRGRKVFGGQRAFLPLRVNHGGVMPIIFASSLMLFPGVVFELIDGQFQQLYAENPAAFVPQVTSWFSRSFQFGAFLYVMVYIAMVYFFSYFWITLQFNPEDMSKQLRDNGSFIPGLRPGPRTAEYLEAVMERITFVGAAFLSVIAVLPMVVNRAIGVPLSVTQFLGGTGLLIVVAVALDFIQRVEANLLMRNYKGFLSGEDGGKGGVGRYPAGT